jgi:phenylacetate-CoA ligase
MNQLVNFMPMFFQNILISIYNTYQYKIRHGGKYLEYRKYYASYSTLCKNGIELEKAKRLEYFLNVATTKSKWYSKFSDYKSLNDFPVLNKTDLINYLAEISTIKEGDAIVSLTGGTTGASMKVLYNKENIQERHAMLDYFRADYGYSLGKKCAWFSGKNIVTSKDIRKGVCYRDDYINKIRFFSTFHITEANFNVYWDGLCNFTPEYIVGFPSSVYEICLMAQSKGLKLNKKVTAFFPTAETVLPNHRQVISSVLGCQLVDQYASSEGAPFILECKSGRLHIHPLTGIFEVVDESMQPAKEGEILVTSFTTEGTPLIRYRVGDRIKLAPDGDSCECGSHFPIVESIEGRSSDYILTPSHGKVNLGNISNATKDVQGIIKFQVIQHKLEEVEVLVLATKQYNQSQQDKFIKALAQRFGEEVYINHNVVNSIPNEKSGKFRIVKNNLVSK